MDGQPVDQASAAAAVPGRRRAARSVLARKLPWNNRAGRLSLLKAATLLLVSLPVLNLLYVALFVGVAPRPFKVPIVTTGQWATWLLLITLAITPARRLFSLPKLIQIRRILGIATLFYTLLHVVLYAADTGYDLPFIAGEFAFRFYLTVGLVATLGLGLLGVTSTDGMIRRMGTLAWRRLHRIVIVVGVAAFIHYYLAASVGAVLYSGYFLWLVGYRVMARLGWKEGFLPLVLLAIAAAIGTGLLEAGWYEMVRPGIAWRVVYADFDFAVEIRPPWRVLADGLAVAVAAEIWRRLKALDLWRILSAGVFQVQTWALAARRR